MQEGKRTRYRIILQVEPNATPAERRLASLLKYALRVCALKAIEVTVEPAPPKAPEAMDLLLGTRGWRRFTWKWVTP